MQTSVGKAPSQNNTLSRIFFYCNSGKTTGWGHVSRCSAIAEAAAARGIAATLLTPSERRAVPKEMLDSFDQVVVRIPKRWTKETWADWATDIRRGTALVIDDYGIEREECARLSSLSSGRAPLILIDDLDLPVGGYFDLVIRPGPVSDFPNGESKRALLTGPEYVLLRRGIIEGPKDPDRLEFAYPPAVVLLGGSNSGGLTACVLKYLHDAANRQITPILIRRRGGPEHDEIEKSLERYSEWRWLSDLNSSELGTWFRSSRYGVCACGVTAYEMAICGLPFLGIVVAENQVPTARMIEASWGLPVIEKADLDSETFTSKWRELTVYSPAQKEVENGGLGGIDGRGAERVVDAILGICRT